MSFDICVADRSLGVCGMSLLAREPQLVAALPGVGNAAGGALRARRVEEPCTSARLSARCSRRHSERVYIIIYVIFSDQSRSPWSWMLSSATRNVSKGAGGSGTLGGNKASAKVTPNLFQSDVDAMAAYMQLAGSYLVAARLKKK